MVTGRRRRGRRFARAGRAARATRAGRAEAARAFTISRSFGRQGRGAAHRRGGLQERGARAEVPASISHWSGSISSVATNERAEELAGERGCARRRRTVRACANGRWAVAGPVCTAGNEWGESKQPPSVIVVVEAKNARAQTEGAVPISSLRVGEWGGGKKRSSNALAIWGKKRPGRVSAHDTGCVELS